MTKTSFTFYTSTSGLEYNLASIVQVLSCYDSRVSTKASGRLRERQWFGTFMNKLGFSTTSMQTSITG